MVDTIFADVAQPDQARIVAINAHNFLKNGGHFVISIKVSKALCTYSKIPVCNKIPPPPQDISLHCKIESSPGQLSLIIWQYPRNGKKLLFQLPAWGSKCSKFPKEILFLSFSVI